MVVWFNLMEIMLVDLKPEIQEQVLEHYGLETAEEGNLDIVPLFVLGGFEEGGSDE